ncbi:integrator complex subunit 2-like [Ptychodera flava]|uniref:integrator complex subunit 2-like n=1 Tax=Ptychodera flava TaxID=63121 RepID=UPI00396A26EF
MSNRQDVSPKAFEAIQTVDVHKIAKLSESEVRPLLPCLVRMSLCAPLDASEEWVDGRKHILRILSGMEVVNSIVALLSVDFNALEVDARKEQHLRQKAGDSESLLSSLPCPALEFERSDPARRLRIIISELLYIMNQIKEAPTEFSLRNSELFENEVYLEEVSDVLCIAQAELPSLLPMPMTAEALLRVKNGNWLLCRLVANVPDCFSEVCKMLVSRGEHQDEESFGGRRRTETLRRLCAMCPTKALTIRGLTVENCRLPGLAIALSLDHCKSGHEDNNVSDLVGFVSGLLLGSNATVRGWLAQFVRIGQKRKRDPQSSLLHALREHLLEELGAIIPSEDHCVIEERHVVQASALIRLYCALRGIATMKFSEEESEQLLCLVTSHPPPTPGGIRFVSLGLCMLLACPSIMSTPDQEKVAISWMNWLVKEGSYFESASGVSASFGEMLLLMAIHFHANQMQPVVDLVCSTLGMKIAVRPNSLARMRLTFTQDIFTEQVVTAHAVTVAVTTNLSATITGFLPVHCIYQLLKSRAFSKHKVAIKDWIYKQLCNSTTPLHPLLPPLIEAYVQSIIQPTHSGGEQARNNPLTESEIISVFLETRIRTGKSVSESLMEVDGENLEESKKSSLTPQLLVLYYILLYEDCLLNNMKIVANSNIKLKSYQATLLAQIPIKHLIQQCQQQQYYYAGLYPCLLRLLATHYPHLCQVEDLLAEELIGGPDVIHHVTYSSQQLQCTPQDLKKAMENVVRQPAEVLILLNQLTNQPASQLMDFSAVIVECLPKLLDVDVPRRVQTLVVALWNILNSIMPRKLRVMTVNSLSVNKYQKSAYTQQDITVDPLIVLRCDHRVFRCPPILDIVLKILTSYLAASRAYLTTHLQASAVSFTKKSEIIGANSMMTEFEREELKNALISTQDSAAIQILLEICLPFEEDKAREGNSSVLREIQCQVCSLLHQMFIADPNIAKLVHFQGYNSELLPVTVAGIPSMHICLDFIPELLSQPQMEKQIFAIQLVSYLCLQYALPKSLSVARLSVNVMSTLLTVLPSHKRSQFFLPTLPALVNICQAFPPLYDDVASMLQQIGRICNSNLAVVSNIPQQRLGLNGDIDPLPDKENVYENLNSSKSTDNITLMKTKNRDIALSIAVQKTFKDIVSLTVMNTKVF